MLLRRVGQGEELRTFTLFLMSSASSPAKADTSAKYPANWQQSSFNGVWYAIEFGVVSASTVSFEPQEA